LFRVSANIRLFLFDFPRSGGNYINYELIETVKDGYWEYGKYEGGTVRRRDKAFVFCFSNEFPDVIKLSLDRWKIIEIVTRDG